MGRGLTILAQLAVHTEGLAYQSHAARGDPLRALCGNTHGATGRHKAVFQNYRANLVNDSEVAVRFERWILIPDRVRPCFVGGERQLKGRKLTSSQCGWATGIPQAELGSLLMISNRTLIRPIL